LKRLAAVFLLLGGCHDQASQPAAPATPTSLEAAAIAAGVIADPDNSDPTGLFARDRDRLCVVSTSTAYRVGVYVDYGDDQACSGTGRATRAGETLHIEMDNAPSCSFDAQFEGDRISFPGRLPDACNRICSRRASISGLIVERLSDSPSEAAAMRDSKGRMLCRGGE
jgi:hypothetical protein